MKKIFLITAIISLFCSIYAQALTDNYKQAVELENTAFSRIPAFGDILRGEGYLPDMDFNYIIGYYRDSVIGLTDNPFHSAAYGIAHYYKDNEDTARFYFEEARSKAALNPAVQLRLFQLFTLHDIDYAVDRQLDELIKLKYRIGSVSIPEAGEYLNYTAVDKFKNNGDIAVIENILISANRVDPYNPEIIMNLLKVSLLKLRPGNFYIIVKMISNSMHDIFNKFVLLHNILVTVRYASLAIFLILTLLLFIKNIKKIFFAIKNNLSDRLTGFQRTFIVIFIITLPLILQLHPLIWVFYLSVINFFFIRRREKILIGLLMLIIIMMPLFFYIENHVVSKMTPSDNLSVIVKANYSGWNIELVEKIDKLIEEQPLNNGLFFAKAMLYKKGGYFNESEEEYNKILLTGESNAQLYNNLGNVLYLKGLQSKAEEYYKRAIDISDKLPEPYFNLAQIYINRMNLTQSDNFMDMATAIDNEKISRFIDNAAEGYSNTEVMDCSIPELYLWNEFYKRSELSNEPVIMGLKINILVMIAGLALLLSGILGSMVKHHMTIMRCFTCGRYVYPVDSREYNEQRVCSKCFKMLDSTVSDSLRARKYESLIRLKEKSFARMSRIMSFIFPGGGKIHQERLFKGIIFIILTVFTILLVFADNIFIVRNPHINYAVDFNNDIILIIVAVLLYIINLAVTKDRQ